MHLGAAFHEKGKRVLVIDADGQNTLVHWSSASGDSDTGIPFPVVNLAEAGGQIHREIKKFIKASVPASVHDKVEHGDHQAMAVFSLPGGKELYATPVGYMEGNQEAYYCDLLFYYDDPHTIYTHWPKELWATIDAHQVKPGMSELQVRTSIGMNMHPDGDKEGDRTVTYDVNGKQYTIAFAHNKATSIQTK